MSFLLVTVMRGGLETLEERLGALGWTLTADSIPEQRVVLVTIDEKSLAEVGPWPWSRDTMARLVNALNQYGVQLQLHDIVYSEPKIGDDALLQAFQAAPAVVLSQLPTLQSNQSVRIGTMTHPLSGVSCGAVPTSTQTFVAAHQGLAAIPKGHISPLFASDGSIRKVPAVICVDGSPYPALSLSALLQTTRSTAWAATLEEGNSWFGPPQLLKLDAYPGLALPLDGEGNFRVSYNKHPDAFMAISAVDVMNGLVEPELLQNIWVLIGTNAFGIGDIWPTPFSGASPGIEIQARILASLLDSTIPYTPRAVAFLQLLLAFGFASLAMALASNNGRLTTWGLPLAAVVLPLFALAAHIQILGSLNIWVGWVFPAIYGIITACLLILLEQSRVRSEHNRVFGNLQSYLPSDIAREIAYSLPSSSIDAKRCDVTLLSADLRNFSAFGEARPPEESAAVLHFFFVRATEIVEQFGGRIQEFKGDSLLAVWDGHNLQAAEKALLAAQKMQLTINGSLYSDHSPPGLDPLVLGIGIEQGPALIGSIGPAQRRSHALLGDTVTVTLRIQEMTAELAQPILIGECAARQLGDYKLESQGSYLLNGLQIPHTLFAPYPVDIPVGASKTNRLQLKVVAGGRT
ncbi:MAG: adenylate/guanylate cyclase domain-containing protein [Pseudohongiellaceae bacterium]